MGPVLPVGARLTRRVREEPPPGDWAAWVSPPAVSPYFSYSRPEAHPKEPQPVDEEDGSTRSADPDRPDGVSDGGHRLPARCCERAGLTGTPPCQMAPPVRERRPPVGTARRRRAESRIATHRDGSRLGAVPIPGGGVPVPGRASAQSALRRSPRFAGRCRPEVGVPLPARRSAWWHGRHAPVQRPRGAFCDSASAPEYEKSGPGPRGGGPSVPDGTTEEVGKGGVAGSGFVLAVSILRCGRFGLLIGIRRLGRQSLR